MNDNIIEKIKLLNTWTYNDQLICIEKQFAFKSYLKNIAFVNAIAWIANQNNHHPDIIIKYNLCIVTITTHDQGGLTEKDIHLASLIDQLIP